MGSPRSAAQRAALAKAQAASALKRSKAASKAKVGGTPKAPKTTERARTVKRAKPSGSGTAKKAVPDSAYEGVDDLGLPKPKRQTKVPTKAQAAKQYREAMSFAPKGRPNYRGR